MGKIEFEGDEAFIDHAQDMMEDATMECGRIGLGKSCTRSSEFYCKSVCPFNDDGDRGLLDNIAEYNPDD